MLKERNKYSNQTGKEEIANGITHGVGIMLSIAALVILLVFSNGTRRVVSFSIYGASLVILYTMSTIYHLVKADEAKRLMQILDHSSIFVLIAGSYTPFTLITMQGVWGWSIFGIIWGLAISGIVFKISFPGRYEFVTVSIYLFMGWLVVFVVNPLLVSLPFMGFIWLLIGGISYSLGVIFFFLEKIPFHHTVFHLFILGGSVCQFFAMLFYVLPESKK